MAESSRYQLPPGVSQLTSRRVSFRKSVSDETLPAEYLEALEQKRRQLDESIHKYIASKEREFKNYEKEVRTRARLPGSIEDNHASESPSRRSHIEDRGEYEHDGRSQDEGGLLRRRTSSESTTHSWVDFGAPAVVMDGHPTTALQALFSNGTRSRHVSSAVEDDPVSDEARATIARLTNRRASLERAKGFAGLFTPSFIKAIDDKSLRAGSTGSASVSLLESPDLGNTGPRNQAEEPIRSLADTAVNETETARNKRPSQLLISSRTSSSGSSADGRLASALKSPTGRDPTKRKRVSLAVGDSIVAPSDNVPLSEIQTSQLPSHSRTRTQTSSDRERGTTSFPSPLSRTAAASPSPTSPQPGASESVEPDAAMTEQQSPPLPITSPRQSIRVPTRVQETILGATEQQSIPSKFEIDPDGDFFDLEEDGDGGLVDPKQSANDDRQLESIADDELGAEIAGRVTHEDLQEVMLHSLQHQGLTSTSQRNPEYDGASGLSPRSEESVQPAEMIDENDKVIVDMPPGSATSSQQPIRPGFRRPSVHADPTFVGSLADYASAETKAVEEEVYGSRYVQPGTNSFKGGSIGESFMERNAAELIRIRNVAGANAIG